MFKNKMFFFVLIFTLGLITSNTNAQALDFFGATKVSVWKGDFKVSNIYVKTQGDRHINGEKMGSDALIVDYHGGISIRAVAIPASADKETASKQIMSLLHIFGTGATDIHQGIIRNEKKSTMRLKNMFHGSESLEIKVTESEYFYNKYNEDRRSWFKLYTIPDAKNKRIIFIAIGETAKVTESRSETFESIMDGMEHRLELQ
ncbi:MAG: hypothetical protein MK212_15725 [Saprospiraceae bacterium]|nr:hypothetical protein [Saprospiraceae bacterium]